MRIHSDFLNYYVVNYNPTLFIYLSKKKFEEKCLIGMLDLIRYSVNFDIFCIILKDLLTKFC